MHAHTHVYTHLSLHLYIHTRTSIVKHVGCSTNMGAVSGGRTGTKLGGTTKCCCCCSDCCGWGGGGLREKEEEGLLGGKMTSPGAGFLLPV